MLDQGGQIPAMVGEVARSKSLAVALRQIEVKDSAGNVVDLTEFIGSDDEDAAADESVEGVAAEPVEEALVDDSAEAAAEAPVADDEKDATKA